MPLVRRSHRKVRSGCAECKRRRIKCDEGKPECQNCLQKKLDCQFVETPAPGISISPSTTAHSKARHTGHSYAIPPPDISRASIAQFQLDEVDTTDFKFLHHFTTSTYRTLTDTPTRQDLWKNQVPELAFDHVFLLRMIFAISALHFCHRSSNTQYLPYAHQQYEASLRSSSAALSKISFSNCNALYACVALGYIFEIGSSFNAQHFLFNNEGSLAHWVIHLRGVRTIMNTSWKDLKEGPLQSMFDLQENEQRLEGFETSLEQLEAHIKWVSVEEEVSSVNSVAIRDLKQWLKVVQVGFFGWMSQVTDEFISLLARKEPFALVVFAHSCVLLKHGEPSYWIDRWPKELLRELSGYIDRSVQEWLQWPLSEFGMSDLLSC